MKSAKLSNLWMPHLGWTIHVWTSKILQQLTQRNVPCFVPNTTQNILWFDVDAERVKIAKHAEFDEGMSNIPLDQLPPNAMQS